VIVDVRNLYKLYSVWFQNILYESVWEEYTVLL